MDHATPPHVDYVASRAAARRGGARAARALSVARRVPKPERLGASASVRPSGAHSARNAHDTSGAGHRPLARSSESGKKRGSTLHASGRSSASERPIPRALFGPRTVRAQRRARRGAGGAARPRLGQGPPPDRLERRRERRVARESAGRRPKVELERAASRAPRRLRRPAWWRGSGGGRRAVEAVVVDPHRASASCTSVCAPERPMHSKSRIASISSAIG